jgi:hypothetical protein
MDFQDLFLRHVGRSFEKQLFFADIIGSRPWTFDMTAGQLSFGDDLSYRMQVIGTEATEASSWLWAWANEVNNMPPALLTDANKLKALGESEKIIPLKVPQVVLDERHNGHNFSLFASGYNDANAYYRGPYEGGAVFMTIHDARFPEDDRHPIQRITTTFPELLKSVPVDNHRAAFAGYLESHEMSVDIIGNIIRGSTGDGQQLAAEFDQQNRLVEMNTEAEQV